MGDYAQAKQHYQASYAIREALDDPAGMAVALNHLGEIAILQKDYAEAEKLYRLSLAIYREIGDRGGLATALNGLGGVAFVLGNVRKARGYFYQALQTATEIQFVPLILSILISVSELLLQTGQGEKSVELLALTIQHPASDQETQNRARKLLTRGEAQLPAEIFINVVERGEAGNFESVVVSLYAELAASEEYPDATQPTLSPHLDPSVQPLLDPLTPRELEVLRLIASGLSNPEIAAE